MWQIDEGEDRESYDGLTLVAYVAATRDGKEVVQLMDKVFKDGKLFKIQNDTEGAAGRIVSNGVEFKTDL